MRDWHSDNDREVRSLARNGRAGFTLLEFVLYIGLSVMVVALLSGIGLRALEAKTLLHAEEDVVYSAYFIQARLANALKEAVATEGPLSGETDTTLTLRNEDPLQDPTVFSLDEGVVTMTVGNGAPVRLMTSRVHAEDLLFSVANEASTTLISYHFTLLKKRGDGTTYGTPTVFSSSALTLQASP